MHCSTAHIFFSSHIKINKCVNNKFYYVTEERSYVSKDQKISEKLVLMYIIFKGVSLCKFYNDI